MSRSIFMFIFLVDPSTASASIELDLLGIMSMLVCHGLPIQIVIFNRHTAENDLV